MRCSALATLGIASVGLFGCRSDLLKEDPLVRPRYGALVARVNVIERTECAERATLVALPEHCAWPVAAAKARVLSVDVQVAAQVGADGNVTGVRVLQGPQGNELGEAAVACARRGEYRAARDEAGDAVSGETCPLTIRLARYASDLEPDDATRTCPPATRTYGAGAGPYGVAAPTGTSTELTDLRCP